jgi:hypothetical protein
MHTRTHSTLTQRNTTCAHTRARSTHANVDFEDLNPHMCVSRTNPHMCVSRTDPLNTHACVYPIIYLGPTEVSPKNEGRASSLGLERWPARSKPQAPATCA